jgi:hypothetical protein
VRRAVATDSIAENVARVLQRAQAGGHGASGREIRAIHQASIANENGLLGQSDDGRFNFTYPIGRSEAVPQCAPGKYVFASAGSTLTLPLLSNCQYRIERRRHARQGGVSVAAGSAPL